jgi:putative hemolysin
MTQDPAIKHCLDHGGTAQLRFPAFGTNPDSFTRLAGERPFCQFTAEDGSQIFVDIDTLYAEAPTMAALAYLTAPPPDAERVTSGANPSTLYCAALGGSSSLGGPYTAAGSGWVLEDEPTTASVMQMCMFPDLFSIDAWGLTHHSNGIIRGRDLTDLFRFDRDRTTRPHQSIVLQSPNAAFRWVMVGALVFLGLVLYTPVLRNLFRFSFLHPIELVICLAEGSLCLLWFECLKGWNQRNCRTSGG